MATAAERDEQKIDIGRVVAQGFEALRRQVVPFTILSLLLAGLPTFLAQYLLSGSAAADPSASLGASSVGLSGFLTVVVGYVLQATLVRSTILDLNGRAADLAGSIALSFRLLLPMIGLAILSMLLVSIGFLLLIVPGVIVYIMLIVAVPALVEERRGVLASMRRSRTLTKGSRGRIFALLLLFLFVYLIISGLVGWGIVFEGDADSLLLAVAGGISSALTALLMSVMLASLYLELRTVKEGASADSLAAIFQ